MVGIRPLTVVFKTGKFAEEGHFNGTDGTISLLADNNLG